MSREIKFRSFHLDDGMLYFDFDTFQRGYHDQYGNITQFTGLKDKNGKDIYEGDIVSAIAKSMWEKHNVISDVIYSHIDCGQWQIRLSKEYTHGLPVNWSVWLSIEIIGNIFENPELLQQ